MKPIHSDINFDDRAGQFGERIYGTFKGRLRLALAWRDLLEAHPEIANPVILSCIDVGGGQGQFSERLLARGHQVVLNDVSRAMLANARERLGEAANLTYLQQSLQALPLREHRRHYDVVVCHAVLEWLAEPMDAIRQLLNLMAPGGVLSLMFYNRDAMVLNDMIKGNYNKLMRGEFAGDPDGLTPPNPLRPEAVINALQDAGAEIISRRGVRCAWDLLRREHRESRSFEDVLAVEWRYGNEEPFWRLGRYVHLVVRLSSG